MIKKKNYWLAFFLSTAMIFISCSDDDDGGTPPVIDPTGSIMVEDHSLMNGMVTINNVVISDDGWLVIYRDNVGAVGTEIIGYTHIDAGTHDDVTVELDEDVVDGETLWAALHVDDDDDGEFDWDGSTGTDVPIRTGVAHVAESFIVTVDSNSVTAENQSIGDDNSITVSNVMLEEAGWIVVHNDEDGNPGEVLGVSDLITAGSHNNVVIDLGDSEVNVGDTLWIMLHTDTGTAGEYEFDPESDDDFDLPILDGDNQPVMISITVTE
jgi:hypothetical protein